VTTDSDDERNRAFNRDGRLDREQAQAVARLIG